MASIDVRHEETGRFERLYAPTQTLAERRAAELRARWNGDLAQRAPGWDAWAGMDAAARSAEAERRIAALTAILFKATRAVPVSAGTVMLDETQFAEPEPVAPSPPQHEREPMPSEFPRRQLTLATLISPRALRRRRNDAESRYAAAHEAWEHLRCWRENEYSKAQTAYRAAAVSWQSRETAFKERQMRANAHLALTLDEARRGESEAVAALCDFNLLALERPQGFPVFWSLSVSDGVVTIDYDMPGMAAIPLVKAVTFAPSRRAYDVSVLDEVERERLYGETVLQTALAVLHVLFAGTDAVRAVVLNGWAHYIDGTAQKPGRACILSVTACREAFAAYDLTAVDPQACFHALNGTVSAKLAAMLVRN